MTSSTSHPLHQLIFITGLPKKRNAVLEKFYSIALIILSYKFKNSLFKKNIQIFFMNLNSDNSTDTLISERLANVINSLAVNHKKMINNLINY